MTLTDVSLEKYGRVLAKVYVRDRCMNDWLVEQRHAVRYDGGKKAVVNWAAMGHAECDGSSQDEEEITLELHYRESDDDDDDDCGDTNLNLEPYDTADAGAAAAAAVGARVRVCQGKHSGSYGTVVRLTATQAVVRFDSSTGAFPYIYIYIYIYI